MRPVKPTTKPCPHRPADVACPLQCKYNHFDDGIVQIDAWDLKCLDCGLRETCASRSDDPDFDPAAEPTLCPFCHLSGWSPGLNPCQRAT